MIYILKVVGIYLYCKSLKHFILDSAAKCEFPHNNAEENYVINYGYFGANNNCSKLYDLKLNFTNRKIVDYFFSSSL